MKISASIVIYNEKEEVLKKAIESILALELDKELIIIDNSPLNRMKKFVGEYKEINYIHLKKNIGFGKAHNLAFSSLKNKSDIHLVVNPDIYFDPKNIKEFILWMNKQNDIVLATPKVLNEDGTTQNIVRNIPTFWTLFKRRINPFGVFDEFIAKDEYQDVELLDTQNIPFAHGCFLVFKREIFEKLGGFDERYFMYMEDVDIFIRAKKFGRTVINTNFIIYHKHRKASAKSLKLLLVHLVSALKFFLTYRKINFKHFE